MSLSARLNGINSRRLFSSFAFLLLPAALTEFIGAVPAAAEPSNNHAASNGTALTDIMRQDAELRDAFFAGPQLGWAVGDRGSIWHTSNGGDEWTLQSSGVSCRLQSIFFIDFENGWAAGGYTEPYTHVSRGVLLRTFDGGDTWTIIRRARIPKVRQVRFFDNRRGWAVAETSGLFGQGLFTTEDGGRTWAPIPASGSSVWLSGSFVDPDSGVVVGRNGVVGQVHRHAVHAAQTQHFGMRSLRQVEMADLRRGYAVGDGGLLLLTTDAGGHWQEPPAVFGDEVDFQTLAVIGDQVWIAGTPGTHVFHSSDGGKNWERFATGQSLPIRALEFVDQQRGWAVGALGMILFTADGGRTWGRQKGVQRRAALLAVFARAEDVPLEAIADLCAGSGYVGVSYLIGRDDFDPIGSADAFSIERSIESLVSAGTSSVQVSWRFPVRPDAIELSEKNIVRLWDEVNQGATSPRLKQRISQQIRIWKPDIVIMPAAQGGPLDGVIHDAVLGGVKQAASAGQHLQPSSRPGLEGWQVKRIFASLPSGSAGLIKVATSRVPVGLGCSLNDFTERPRGLLTKHYRPVPLMQQFELVEDTGGSTTVRRDFFSGLLIHAGGDARRKSVRGINEVSAGNQRTAERRRMVEAIVASAARDGRTAAAALAQIDRFTSELDESAAADLLFQLGSLFHHEGRWVLAEEVFIAMADSYPEHESAMPAMVWLLQYYASTELQHVARGISPAVVRQVRADSLDLESGRVERPKNTAGIEKRSQAADQQAIAWAAKIQKKNILLHGEPFVRFPLAAVWRRQNKSRQAERIYRGVQLTRDRDAWWQNATDEMQRISGRETPGPAAPTRTMAVVCRRADGKPLLDGQLSDPCWKMELEHSSTRANLQTARLYSGYNDDAEWPATVRLAYDDAFLYIAAKCRKSSGTDYPTTKKPRTRDANLASRDRIELLIDLDRDWTTYYRLVIDHRGWTYDACGSVAAWNPKWFVAAAADDEHWTCEAAIPFRELTSRNPQTKSAWAVGIQRIVPKVGFQSWTQPAGPDILPEGFGYVKFE